MALEAGGKRTGTGLALLLMGIVSAMLLLYFGRAVFEPLVFALFIIALTAPFMHKLRPVVGKGLAMLLTVALTLAVLFVFFSIVFWGISQVAGWVMANLGQFDAAYREVNLWLAKQDMPLDVLLPASFDPRWVVGPIMSLVEQARLISGFALLVFVFAVLGLTELDGMARRMAKIEADRPNLKVTEVVKDVSAKFGLYMKVRLVVSLIDTLVCYIFFRIIGLEEPLAWAILVGTMNFIPFIGPLLVTVAIALFTAAQFGSLWMVVLAAGGTSIINFVLGSYIEPLMAGNALSMSAVLVLFSVFFWAIFWGIPGAFIGVQIMIVILAVLRRMPSAAWLAELFSGDSAEKAVSQG
ncbi:AI-2E family transporter [Sandaracinobacter sp. RS1-74]|uniref:AI-2E family transporter n=1 Tax=Sandaracinobacteroides sayramensis TaxID=2913411 RepID=UPI001EDBE31F|nr:AI-2E family transporter [Sandaracinobacteroides sayramensis]MCG2840155.1 AI-2E family transporter [Sandaracinobacteroides sayramensis]